MVLCPPYLPDGHDIVPPMPVWLIDLMKRLSQTHGGLLHSYRSYNKEGHYNQYLLTFKPSYT